MTRYSYKHFEMSSLLEKLWKNNFLHVHDGVLNEDTFNSMFVFGIVNEKCLSLDISI